MSQLLKYLELLLVAAWRRQALWLQLLKPLELSYRGLDRLQFLWQTRLRRQVSLELPLIVVGSLNVGGSGKTPSVIALAQELQQRGLRIGIISRGYKRQGTKPREVKLQDEVSWVGDEPQLIKWRTGCPVFVGRERYLAAQKLLSEYRVDVLISDDGLQHYRLKPQLALATIDGAMGLSNGCCLPVGPLRQPPKHLKQVDFVLYNLAHAPNSLVPRINPKYLPQTTSGRDFTLTRASLSFIKLTTELSSQPEEFSLLKWQELQQGRQLYAAAAIAAPQNFFATLKEQRLDFIAKSFANHHKFTAADLEFARAGTLIMTEKDAVKCTGLGYDNIWALRIEYNLDQQLVACIMEVL